MLMFPSNNDEQGSVLALTHRTKEKKKPLCHWNDLQHDTELAAKHS